MAYFGGELLVCNQARGHRLSSAERTGKHWDLGGRLSLGGEKLNMQVAMTQVPSTASLALVRVA